MRKFFLVNLERLPFQELARLITQGAQSTHACFTPEYLAGQYAYWEASGRDSLNNRTFNDELKLLRHIGAVFITEQALEEANKFKQALTDDSVSFHRVELRQGIKDLSLAQLQAIDEKAPDGTVWVAYNVPTHPLFYDSYFKFRAPFGWCASGYHFKTLAADYKYVLKLSEIRAQILKLEEEASNQRVAELNQSVALAKNALSTFSYEPSKNITGQQSKDSRK